MQELIQYCLEQHANTVSIFYFVREGIRIKSLRVCERVKETDRERLMAMSCEFCTAKQNWSFTDVYRVRNWADEQKLHQNMAAVGWGSSWMRRSFTLISISLYHEYVMWDGELAQPTQGSMHSKHEVKNRLPICKISQFNHIIIHWEMTSASQQHRNMYYMN